MIRRLGCMLDPVGRRRGANKKEGLVFDDKCQGEKFQISEVLMSGFVGLV